MNDERQEPLGDPDADTPQVEVELEVVTYYRPRLVRVGTGSDGEVEVYRLSPDHGQRTDVTTALLWVYYEACRSGTARADRLPWIRPTPDMVWEKFRQALTAATTEGRWWMDEGWRCEQARMAYRHALKEAPGEKAPSLTRVAPVVRRPGGDR